MQNAWRSTLKYTRLLQLLLFILMRLRGLGRHMLGEISSSSWGKETGSGIDLLFDSTCPFCRTRCKWMILCTWVSHLYFFIPNDIDQWSCPMSMCSWHSHLLSPPGQLGTKEILENKWWPSIQPLKWTWFMSNAFVCAVHEEKSIK